jgi:hypothetical protein
MFNTVAAISSLDVQLIYYRGHDECRATQWFSSPAPLKAAMVRVMPAAGHTQIRRIIEHAKTEHQKQAVNAMVFIGDACEEKPADLYGAAERLNTPLFLFREGNDPVAKQVFEKLAIMTHGAHVEFNTDAVGRLGELLKAVAAFAVGGTQALLAQNTNISQQLLAQIKK